jgi:hypothetical protein
MPTTASGIRYPASSAAINISGDFLNLATDVDTYVTTAISTNNGTQNASVAASLATIQGQANTATSQANAATAAYASASTGLEISMIMGVFNA